MTTANAIPSAVSAWRPQAPDAPAQTPMPLCISDTLAYIASHLDQRLALQALAAQAGLSVWRFSALFRRHLGVSPRHYIREQRLRRVQALLAQGVLPADAALAVGYYDQSHLTRRFKNSCGMTPGQYLEQRSACVE